MSTTTRSALPRFIVDDLPAPADFWCAEHPLADLHCTACGSDRSHIELLHVGPEEIMRCTKHCIATHIGGNLLSSWQLESEADWAPRRRELESYYEAEVYGPHSDDAPPAVKRAMDQYMRRLPRRRRPRFGRRPIAKRLIVFINRIIRPLDLELVTRSEQAGF